MKRFVAGAALLLFPAAAWSFCGVYVGGASSEIYNRVSEVAMVRIGDQTTLTVYNDVQGDTDDFALLIPVPEVLPLEALHTLSPDIFNILDRYSAPRRVRYECDDFVNEADVDTDTDSDTDTDTDSDTDADVQVEAEYIVGEYDVVVLSSGDAGDLQSWLNGNGYVLPADNQGILDSYIDQGTYFLAAKVNEDAGILPGDRLSPLQMTYTAEAWSLPIRIGTLSAVPGEPQDLIIYAVTPYEAGQTQISNYPRAELETGCMWLPPDDGEFLNAETFAAFYLEEFDAAYEEVGRGFWASEYAWGGGKCDPCEGDPPGGDELFTLGLPKENISDFFQDMFFTRLHVRYTPEEATEDLMLYSSQIVDSSQQRYIDYSANLEDRFPICGLGYPLDPGSCDDPDGRVDGRADDPSQTREGPLGCGERAAGIVLLTGLFGAGMRRRRQAERS